jgi:hypothetical protein
MPIAGERVLREGKADEVEELTVCTDAVRSTEVEVVVDLPVGGLGV